MDIVITGASKGFGKAFTVINLDVLAVQPKAEVTVTVKVPVVATEILVVVAPVLHTYVPPPVPVSVALAPAQMIPSFGVSPDVSATVVPATGKGLTVNATDAKGAHAGSTGSGSKIAYIT